jgi:hypothetical protein
MILLMHHSRLRMASPYRASLTLGQWLVASSTPKTSFVDWHIMELLVVPKQLGLGLGDLWESFDELPIISY